MAKLEINLSQEDTERLFCVKWQAGKKDMTGEEYAKELLERALRELCPRVPKDRDECGNYIF